MVHLLAEILDRLLFCYYLQALFGHSDSAGDSGLVATPSDSQPLTLARSRSRFPARSALYIHFSAPPPHVSSSLFFGLDFGFSSLGALPGPSSLFHAFPPAVRRAACPPVLEILSMTQQQPPHTARHASDATRALLPRRRSCAGQQSTPEPRTTNHEPRRILKQAQRSPPAHLASSELRAPSA